MAPAAGGSDLTINASGTTQIALVLVVIAVPAVYDRFLSATPIMFPRKRRR